MNEEGIKYQRAKERVESLRWFYFHLGVYLLVNLFLFLLNIITSPDSLWFYWPLLAWGVGLILHGFFVLASVRLFGADREEKKTREIMEEERRD